MASNLPAHNPQTGELEETETSQALDAFRGSGLAAQLVAAEIDQQITTAHAYPRDPRRAMNVIKSLATLDETTAAECVYALPRGKKPIRGPSIRFAEIVQSAWGNCRVGTRVVHVDRIEKYVEAEGVFHDLETNSLTTARVRRRLSTQRGELLTEDMIIVTGNAAAAIAKRNAIMAGVPRALWRGTYDLVESVIAGDVKTLAERRAATLKAFAAFGVKPEQICAVLDIPNMDALTVDHMPTLIGLHQAIKNEETTVEAAFPTMEQIAAAKEGEKQEAKPKNLAGKLEQVAKSGKDKAKPAAPAADKNQKSESGSATDPEIGASSSRGGESAEEPSSGASTTPVGAQGGGSTESTDEDEGQGAMDFDDDEEDDEVTEEDLADARANGAEKKAAGAKRQATPAKYREPAALLEAWQLGYDTGSAERVPGEEG